MKLRACTAADVTAIHAIINDAAQAYRGVIPADCWHEPYMPLAELRRELMAGIAFHGAEHDGELAGVMGLQDRGEVALIRHAYVRTVNRRAGVGGALLRELEARTRVPLLIGTWLAADWAIRFYERHGYRALPPEATARLLARYWAVPARQASASVVLAGPTWTGD